MTKCEIGEWLKYGSGSQDERCQGFLGCLGTVINGMKDRISE